MRGLLALSSAFVLLTKLAGFVRGVIFAAYLGTSITLDAYNGMLVIAGAIVFIAADQFELLTSAETAVEAAKGTDAFRTYVSQAATLAFAGGIILGVLAVVLMPLLAPVLVPTTNEVSQLPLVSLALTLLPLVVLHIPSRVMAALLRGSGRAPLSILLDGLQGLGFLLFGSLTLYYLSHGSEASKVLGVALSQSAGLAVVITIQFVVLWRASGRSPLRLASLQAAIPFGRRLAVISGLNSLNYGFTFIDRHFAAKVVDGGLSLVNYAGNISLTLRSALAYDHLYVVEFSQSKDRAKSYDRAVSNCLWLTVPLCGLLPVFAHDLVRLVFQRGQFTAEMAAHSGGVLAVYGGFTTGFLLWQLMFRILQLEQCLRAMYVPGIVALVISLALTPLTTRWWGLAGAICGTVVGIICLLAWGTWLLRQRGISLLPPRRLAWVLALGGYAWLVSEGLRRMADPTHVIKNLAAIFAAGALAYVPSGLWWWRQQRISRHA